MPRQARLDIPGALHHIMISGINIGDIFMIEILVGLTPIFNWRILVISKCIKVLVTVILLIKVLGGEFK